MANPTLLEMPIARDGAKNSIPSTTSPTTGLLSQQFGWQDINSMPVQQGGKAPSRLDFNGVLNLLSNILFYTQKGWQFEWDSSQAYYAGCIVKDTSDGKMYQCLNDVTSTTAPHSDTTNWKVWDLSMLSNYLPLAGGTLTGATIKRNVDNEYINLIGGNSDGASILIYGKDADGGSLHFLAADASAQSHLYQTASGNLRFVPDNINNHSIQHDLGGSAIVAKSLTSNGYVKRASGEIIQWGATGVPANATEVTVSFPISFGTFYRMVVTSELNGHPTALDIDDNGSTLQTKKIVIGTPYAYTGAIHWIAIGY